MDFLWNPMPSYWIPIDFRRNPVYTSYQCRGGSRGSFELYTGCIQLVYNSYTTRIQLVYNSYQSCREERNELYTVVCNALYTSCMRGTSCIRVVWRGSKNTPSAAPRIQLVYNSYTTRIQLVYNTLYTSCIRVVCCIQPVYNSHSSVATT